MRRSLPGTNRDPNAVVDSRLDIAGSRPVAVLQPGARWADSAPCEGLAGSATGGALANGTVGSRSCASDLRGDTEVSPDPFADLGVMSLNAPCVGYDLNEVHATAVGSIRAMLSQRGTTWVAVGG